MSLPEIKLNNRDHGCVLHEITELPFFFNYEHKLEETCVNRYNIYLHEKREFKRIV